MILEEAGCGLKERQRKVFDAAHECMIRSSSMANGTMLPPESPTDQRLKAGPRRRGRLRGAPITEMGRAAVH